MLLFKYNYTDSGFCRVNFKVENDSGQTINYCLMEDGCDVKMYRTTGGDWDEPEYPVKLKPGVVIDFETPPDEYGQELVRRYKESLNA